MAAKGEETDTTPPRSSSEEKKDCTKTVEEDEKLTSNNNETERLRLEKEEAEIEAEKEKIEKKEKEEVERKAEEISKLINPDSSDDEGDKTKAEKTDSPPDKPKVPFWDFALNHLLVGLGSLVINGTAVTCGSCQKELDLASLKGHLQGDGHKLNALWNYDRSLAEVTGRLRDYPQKFEMEMFKHITLLNRMEKRHNVLPSVECVIRDLFNKEELGKAEVKNESKKPEIPPEELAEIKAEFIGSFPHEDDSILVQQALMGELNGYSSSSSAISALKLVTMLGKLICSYQRKNLNSGYRVNEQCIKEIKEHCIHLLKLVDESRLMNR